MKKSIAKEIAEEIVKILKEDDSLKKVKELTPFQKTEKLLSELSLLKGAVDAKNMLISDLKKDGILIQKKEVGVNVQASKTYLSELEKIEKQKKLNHKRNKKWRIL